jgi:RNA 3'-terminal phosphate cyclase
MGLAGKGSFTTRELTQHCLTNIHVTGQILDVQFSINKINGLYEISVE